MAASSPADRAAQLYHHGKYRAALSILLDLAEKDGGIYQLIGQCYYMEGQAKVASVYFEMAVSADPANSVYHHWLGRAYGRRAETASFFKAPIFASKARSSFEKAVQLGPHNLEAINDLFEYYVEAPGFLGGGVDKAAALAGRIRALNLAEYHYALARLAEKRRQFRAVEDHLRRAVELAPRDAGRLTDLAQFLEKQGRHRESDEAFTKARALAPRAPGVLFAQAKTYIDSRRNLDAARTLLVQYFALDVTPDDPPRWEAEKLLGQIPGS